MRRFTQLPILFFCFFFILSQNIYTQKYDYNWLFGYNSNDSTLPLYFGSHLNFENAPIEVNAVLIGERFNFTNCVLSDFDGNLRLYTNGYKILNSNNELMVNGDSLNFNSDWSIWNFHKFGHYIPAGVVALPNYENPNDFTLVHQPTIVGSNPRIQISQILYSKLSLGDEVGDEVILEKNIELAHSDSLFRIHITATKHANGRDWWMVVPTLREASYYTYLLSEGNFSEPNIQYIGSPPTSDISSEGYNAFSPDGTKYVDFGVKSEIKVFNFDRCTGELNSLINLPFPDTTDFGGGVAFSPNNRFLYVDDIINVYQYDLWDSDILNSKEVVAVWDGYIEYAFNGTPFYVMQNGPDGKIYIGTSTGVSKIHVIEKPNEKGLDCRVVQRRIQLPHLKLPEFPHYPNYRLGPIDGSPCDTLGIDNLPMANYTWEIPDSMSLLDLAFTDNSFYEPTDWFWDFGDGETSTEMNPSHDFPAEAIYEVCLTVSNQYGEHTQCREIDLLGAVSTAEEDADAVVSIFPNPASDKIIVQLSEKLSHKITSLRLKNSVGMEVFQMETGQSEVIELDVFEVAAGIYTLEIMENDHPISIQKVVIFK